MTKYAPRTSTAALKRALTLVGKRNAVGWCLKEVAAVYGVPGVGDWDRDGDADTRDYFKAAQRNGKVVLTSNPAKIPAGAMVFWDAGFGHVAIGAGGGKVVSTDRPRDGKWGLVTIDSISKAWGKRLLGYVLVDGNGYTLTDAPPPVWFRLLFWNVAGFNETGIKTWATRRAGIVAEIRASRAAVVGLVEVSAVMLPFLDDQLLPLGYTRAPHGTDGRHIYVKAAKVTVAQSGNFNLTPLYKGDDKQAAWFAGTIDGSRAMVAVGHLESDSAAGADLVRVKQMNSQFRQAYDVAKGLGISEANTVHAVDTNSEGWVTRKSANPHGYVDAFVQAPVHTHRDTGSYVGWAAPKPGPRIDFIYVEETRPVQVAAQRLVKGSDHLPQVIDIGRQK